MASSVMDAYPEPIPIAVIGGTGIQDLPGFKHAATLNITTPWGPPAAPIRVLLHTAAGGDQAPTPIAFLPRHGEGHAFNPSAVPFRANIAALRKIGVRVVVAFTAVGSLRSGVRPRDFVCVDQIIDRTKGIRSHTFFDKGPVVHVPLADPFDNRLRGIINAVGRKVMGTAPPTGLISDEVPAAAATEARAPDDQARLHESGTVICIEGPHFSTRAESRMYRAWGGTVINMSAVPEAALAREAEMSYALVAMATDYDCWRGEPAPTTAEPEPADPDSGAGLAEELDVSVAAVMATMHHNAALAKTFVGAVLDSLVAGGSAAALGNRWAAGTELTVSSADQVWRATEAEAKWRWLFG